MAGERFRWGLAASFGKVDGRGNGRAILCARGCYPDEAGAALLGSYSDESPIDRFIALGSIGWLETEPEESEAYHRDRGYHWEHCQPYSFKGGTEAFFGEYWGPGPEWLYVWDSRRLAGESGDGGEAAAELF